MALKEAAVMTERIDDEQEKREHRAMIGEALVEAQLYQEQGCKSEPKLSSCSE